MDSCFPMYCYNSAEDILEVFLESRHNCLEEKEFDDIIVYRNKHDNKVIGFTIYNYNVNREILNKMYPIYKWDRYY